MTIYVNFFRISAKGSVHVQMPDDCVAAETFASSGTSTYQGQQRSEVVSVFSDSASFRFAKGKTPNAALNVNSDVSTAGAYLPANVFATFNLNPGEKIAVQAI
ncbi:hypothetical protein [Rhizobium sp. TRM95796]|uniref:hypothetical protein n=1 Tax=Rhizobium sp. TRM95796 TaxID=2979862 RepID=UPI0021E91ABC|nr:hypothetical protein [Rhizobium sp. TRM95796]MCV3764039.1 hypothetical protein [Rhizobium sp. TRM95796]